MRDASISAPLFGAFTIRPIEVKHFHNSRQIVDRHLLSRCTPFRAAQANRLKLVLRRYASARTFAGQKRGRANQLSTAQLSALVDQDRFAPRRKAALLSPAAPQHQFSRRWIKVRCFEISKSPLINEATIDRPFENQSPSQRKKRRRMSIFDREVARHNCASESRSSEPS